MFGGDSIVADGQLSAPRRPDRLARDHHPARRDRRRSRGRGAAQRRIASASERLKQELMRRIQSSPELRSLRNHVSFTENDEGLRIDLIDEADFSMFQVGTDRLLPDARRLVGEVAQVIAGVPNAVDHPRPHRFAALCGGPDDEQLAALDRARRNDAGGAAEFRRADRAHRPDRGRRRPRTPSCRRIATIRATGASRSPWPGARRARRPAAGAAASDPRS